MLKELYSYSFYFAIKFKRTIFAIVIAGKSHDIDILYFNIHIQPSVKFQLSLGVEPFTTDPNSMH